MTRSPKQPGGEHVFMSMDDQKDAYELFMRKYSKRLPEIRRRLEQGISKIDAGDTVAVETIIRQRIPRGLIAIIDNVDPIFGDDKIHAYFFLSYFIRALDQSDAEGIKSLNGRLSDALNHKSKFCDLFWELAVANTYFSHGNSVEFIPQSKNFTPDFVVKGKWGKLWVECKCPFVLSRQPVPDKLLHRALHILKNRLHSETGNGCIMTAHYSGGPDVNIDEGVSDLQVAGKNLDENGLVGKSKYWNLVRHVNYRELTENIDRFVYGPPEERPIELSGFSTVQVGDNSALVFVADNQSGFNITVAEKVRHGLKQLPWGELGVIWIQASGFIARSVENLDGFSQWAFSDAKARSMVSSRLAKDDRFIGVTINTDFSFEERDGHYFINYFAHAATTTKLDVLRTHDVGFLGRSEEAFAQSMAAAVGHVWEGAGSRG